jgi:allantoinase
MSDFDLLLRSRHLDGRPVAIGIAEGQFQAVAADLTGAATEEIDHTHGFLLPGWIDSHVHFNEPGRTEWEGLTTGSRALAAGGGTTFFDMPLNSSPPVLNAVSFEAKRALAEEKSCLDFALWGGLTPDSLDHLEAMAELGAIGYKAFMCPSGLDEFAHAEAATLKAGMKKAVALGLPVAVHAEINPTTRPTGHDMAAWLTSRPIQLELDAIAIALELAGETGCALHIVHVSNPEGIDLINTAKKRKASTSPSRPARITCCSPMPTPSASVPQPNAPRLCARLKRSKRCDKRFAGGRSTPSAPIIPPPRPTSNKATTSSPSGAASQASSMACPCCWIIDLAPAALISSNVAQRFRLANKGGFIVGHDADFSLVTPTPHTLTASALLTRHSISPYLGLTAQHQVIATYLRGQRVTSITRGQFLRPTPSLWHLASSLQSS